MNLTEINAGNIIESAKTISENPDLIYKDECQEEFNNRARVAAFFGTLQAGFTDFHYLRPIWKQITEKDSLVGVGITGICNGDILPLNLPEAANVAVEENKRVASIIGINSAARVTTINGGSTK